MIPENNVKALTAYIDGWRVGDAARIHAVMDENYAIDTGIPDMDPVPKAAFVGFFGGFRASIAEQGGPAIDDTHFMDIYGINRRHVGNLTLESALFVVPGFGSGTYLIAAKDGKVLFEDASILPVTVTGPT